MPDKQKIRLAIEEGNYEGAAELIKGYISEPGQYDDTIAIYDAAIGEACGDRKRMWEAIRSGLLKNCRNYELYVMLGNYYLCENMHKSWLCYENALFYCDNTEDRAGIRAMMDQLEKEYGIFVNKVAVVILSYNLLEYTKSCIESIRKTTPERAREIIVVDNASEDGSAEWLKKQEDIILVANKENMGFPAGCNQGIRAAGKASDIFLLNNDTLLAENALFWLRMGLYDKEKNGAAGSMSNYAPYDQSVCGDDTTVPGLLDFGRRMNIPEEYPYESRLFLIGFALLIRRPVVDEIGLLDERFSPGQWEDVDYGLRIVLAGYRNVLCKNSFILHYGGQSFGKNEKKSQALIERNQKILNEKWGLEVLSHSPIVKLIQYAQEPEEAPIRILDIGCGCGASLGYAGSLYPNAEVYGVEKNPQAAKVASCMGTVVCGDVEETDLPWGEGFFDYVLMGEILEHLRDPEIVLKKINKCLKTGGHLIASVPNMKHYSVLLPLLLEDRFSYGDGGILNSSHLKLYTGKEISELLSRNGYTVEWMKYTLAAGEPKGEEARVIRKLAEVTGEPSGTSMLAYQYIIKAAKAREAANT